jgi:hypothetical protein
MENKMSKRVVSMEERQQTTMNKMQKSAELYYDKYRDQMDLLEHSILAQVKKNKGGIQAYDIYALGKQLEQFEDHMAFNEEQGNVNLLGQIPNIAFDVITAVFGASIIPVVASVQPIDEERGTVYFKTVRDATTKGSQTAGEVTVDPRQNVVTPIGYSNNSFQNVAQAGTTSGTTTYTFTLAGFPIKSETFSVSLASAPAVQGKDIGAYSNYPSNTDIGNIWGAGVSGTINYLTGSVTLNFTADPGTHASNIIVSYQQNYELSTDLPQIDSYFASTGIFANVYALKGTVGLLQSYGMSKRFGLVAEDEVAKDLVQEINREIGGDLIRTLSAIAQGTTTYNDTPPTGVSLFEHRQTYKYSLAAAEGQLVANAGRGTISLLIVGLTHASLIQTLPGWVKLYDGNGLGSHVYGTLDGITVIRVMESNILASSNGLAVWKGLSPFEAAVVYAPYMPLTVTAVLPQAPNPLQSMRAAAVWAGVEGVVPNYVTNFNVTNVPL